jgi:hypothetical protein
VEFVVDEVVLRQLFFKISSIFFGVILLWLSVMHHPRNKQYIVYPLVAAVKRHRLSLHLYIEPEGSLPLSQDPTADPILSHTKPIRTLPP